MQFVLSRFKSLTNYAKNTSTNALINERNPLVLAIMQDTGKYQAENSILTMFLIYLLTLITSLNSTVDRGLKFTTSCRIDFTPHLHQRNRCL